MVMDKPNDQVVKVTQAFGFLLSKDSNHKMPRIKLVKLLWAADRYHIRNYGRTVSGVEYFAFKHGPVASIALAIARQNSDYELTENDISYVEQFFTSDRINTAMSASPGEDYLSDTDKEALEFACDKFGDLDRFELADNISHRYPEWACFSKYFEDGNVSPKTIDNEKFFENPDGDDDFTENEERLAAAKEIYEENLEIERLLGN